MDAVIWQGRMCIILEDGCWALSAVGRYCDFDFAGGTPDSAVTGRCDYEGRLNTILLCPIDDDRLLLIQDSRQVFVMIGNPNTNGRIELLEVPSA